MINVTIVGRLGADGEIRHAGDRTVLGFRVAADYYDRGSKTKGTWWFRCSLWGVRGERLAQYMTKGSQVVVVGELTQREYNGSVYHEIDAHEVALCGGGGQRHEQTDESDDVPFG